MISRIAIIIIATIWFFAGTLYYPKWKLGGSEASISWDVSGYYHYLPGIFIYHDLKQQNWMAEINKHYLPSPAYDQSYGHKDSGNKVNKYAIGQAIMYAPFFLAAHLYTSVTKSFPPDGYSRPYQIAIWLGGLLVSLLGLVLLRIILLHYFTDITTAWTLVALALATHWMEYAAISNGMNHTWLFTLLCGLILLTIRFYKHHDITSVIGIGITIGLAALTRPTEIIWVLIPLLWNIESMRSRLSFLLAHKWKLMIAVVACGVVLFIQPLYWKYATGEWIVYSYGEQHFDWLHPRIRSGLIGTNVGWWAYTPMMFVAMFGWVQLYRKYYPLFWPVFITGMLAIYITLSWPYWEQGGGLGQRNLIQVYPLFAFPLAALITWLNKSGPGKWVWIVLLALNIYYTGWWVHQAHKGGFFQPGQMTTPYFLQIAGRPHPDPGLFKLLDTRDYFYGTPEVFDLIYENDFETDSTLQCTRILADSSVAACLDANTQFAGPYHLPVTDSCKQWLRLQAEFNIQSREWNVWKYTQWIIHFYHGDQVIKASMIRVHRFLPQDYINYPVHFDVRIPREAFDRCTVTFWNADSPNTILIDDLKAYCFE
jgi:hypothetical protein